MDAAIRVRGACKTYGRGDTATRVLDNLDMTVQRGSIYGLLGASGCGKTTLLSCIVGRRSLDSGEITLLDGKPGQRSTVSRIGYMPQEVALVGEFTVRDAFYYFGWIFGMPNDHIEKRFELLTTLLDLPSEDQLVRHLSGGQQRRVSFAVGLVHNPELLILDEPTVGLDPELRARIWDYFLELTAENLVTIIITTHYIEEANQANFIGLMRNGKLLAEKPPASLLSQFNVPHLEDVFLILSKQQQDSQQQLFSKMHALEGNEENSANGCLNGVMDVSAHDTKPVSPVLAKPVEKYESKATGRMKALLTKCFYRIVRDISGIIFTLGFPIIQLISFYYGVGREPWGLGMAVVNDELGNNCENNYTQIIYNNSDYTCNVQGLSCFYLSFVDDVIFHKEFYASREEAIEAVRTGTMSGVIYFHQNFSDSLKERIEAARYASEETVLHSELQVNLDMSNQQIAYTMQNTLVQAYLDFVESILETCNMNPKLVKVPMQMNDPVFGDGNQNYAMFMAPAIMMSLSFFLALMLTAIVIIGEKHDGVWDRSIVAGVTFSEIVTSLVMVHSIFMLLQVAMILIFSFYILGVKCHGDIYTVIALVILQGFSGMCFGFVTSTVCESMTMAIYFALGSFYPYIFLSGLMWPIEALPKVLRWFGMCLPGTVPIISLRNVLDRGWSILQPNVFDGFLITLFWIALECGICVVILRMKNK